MCLEPVNVFGAGVKETARRLAFRSPLEITASRMSLAHHSSRWVEERGLLCLLQHLELTETDEDYGSKQQL